MTLATRIAVALAGLFLMIAMHLNYRDQLRQKDEQWTKVFLDQDDLFKRVDAGARTCDVRLGASNRVSAMCEAQVEADVAAFGKLPKFDEGVYERRLEVLERAALDPPTLETWTLTCRAMWAVPPGRWNLTPDSRGNLHARLDDGEFVIPVETFLACPDGSPPPLQGETGKPRP